MKLAKNIYFLIGLAIVLILFNTLFFTHLISLNRKYSQTVGNSHRILQASNGLLTLIKDAEAGQNRYLITGDPANLAPFHQARKQFEPLRNRLNILTDTLHYTRANMERLHDLLDRKMNFIARTVEARRRGDQATALRMVRSGESQALMASIRREMENMLVDEEARLDEYSANLDKYSRRTKNYAAISNGVLLIIAIASLLDIRSNRKRIRKLFGENEEKNRMLEEQTADLQRLSHDLIQQNRELERFAYVASHDLRAPAGNIEALLRLYKEAKDKDERESLIDTMQDVSENLSTKLNDLVDGLRGKGEVNRMSETLPLQSIYDKVIKNLSVDIRKADAEITRDFSEAPEITSPNGYIESILQNLISNAIKYRDPSRKPEIRVRSHKQQGRTCIVVSDNGLGIDMEKHGADLFGLYKTFHNNRNSKGVGLYSTRAQVRALGGRIEGSSTPGKGSTFTGCL